MRGGSVRNADRSGGDRNRIDLAAADQLLDAREDLRDTEPLSHCSCSLLHRVADRADDDAVRDVRLRQVREDAALRERSDADDADP